MHSEGHKYYVNEFKKNNNKTFVKLFLYHILSNL